MSSNWIITICQMLLLDMSQQSRQYCVKQLDNNNLSNVVTGYVTTKQAVLCQVTG